MIRLVGPGGAGKITVGVVLVDRIGIPFVDLDREFTTRAGDISAYLSAHGYNRYANLNVQVYLDTIDCETCVAETVRRQLRRPFSRPAWREEQVIRQRFGVYRDLPVKKFETARSVEAVVRDLVTHLCSERV